MKLKFVKIINIILLNKFRFLSFESDRCIFLKINWLIYFNFCQKQQINILKWAEWRWAICPFIYFEVLVCMMTIHSFYIYLFLYLTICFSYLVDRLHFMITLYFKSYFWTHFYCLFNLLLEFYEIHFVFYMISWFNVEWYKNVGKPWTYRNYHEVIIEC